MKLNGTIRVCFRAQRRRMIAWASHDRNDKPNNGGVARDCLATGEKGLSLLVMTNEKKRKEKL